MSETACRTCGDLKRQYGWALDDLRAAARKMVRADGRATFQEQVDQAKAQKRRIAEQMNQHAETERKGAA